MALRRWPHREESSELPPPRREPCAPLPQVRNGASPLQHRRTTASHHQFHRDPAKSPEPPPSTLAAQQKQRCQQENTTREAPHTTPQNRFGDHKEGCIQQIAFFITTVFYTLSSAHQAEQLPQANLQPYPSILPNYPHALHQPPQLSSSPTLPRLLPAASKRSDDQPRRSYHCTLPPRPPEHASNASTDHVTHSTPFPTLNRYPQTLHLTNVFVHITQLPSTHTSHTAWQVLHYHTFSTQLHPYKVYIHYHTHNAALTRGGSQPTAFHSPPSQPYPKWYSGPPLLARPLPPEESTPTNTQPHPRQKYSYNVPPRTPQTSNRLHTHPMPNAHSPTGHHTQLPSPTIPTTYSQQIALHSHTPTIQSSPHNEYPTPYSRTSHLAPALHTHSYPPDKTHSGWPSAPLATNFPFAASQIRIPLQQLRQPPPNIPQQTSPPEPAQEATSRAVHRNHKPPSPPNHIHNAHIDKPQPLTPLQATPKHNPHKHIHTLQPHTLHNYRHATLPTQQQPIRYFLKPSTRQHSYQVPSKLYRHHHTQLKHPKLQPYTNPPKSPTVSQLKLPEALAATAKTQQGTQISKHICLFNSHHSTHLNTSLTLCTPPLYLPSQHIHRPLSLSSIHTSPSLTHSPRTHTNRIQSLPNIVDTDQLYALAEISHSDTGGDTDYQLHNSETAPSDLVNVHNSTSDTNSTCSPATLRTSLPRDYLTIHIRLQHRYQVRSITHYLHPQPYTKTHRLIHSTTLCSFHRKLLGPIDTDTQETTNYTTENIQTHNLQPRHQFCTASGYTDRVAANTPTPRLLPAHITPNCNQPSTIAESAAALSPQCSNKVHTHHPLLTFNLYTTLSTITHNSTKTLTHCPPACSSPRDSQYQPNIIIPLQFVTAQPPRQATHTTVTSDPRAPNNQIQTLHNIRHTNSGPSDNPASTLPPSNSRNIRHTPETETNRRSYTREGQRNPWQLITNDPSHTRRKSLPAYTHSKPAQPSHHPSTMSKSIQDQYIEFRHQVAASTSFQNEPTSHQPLNTHDFGVGEDLDMVLQLENVSPERGGSSLQMSMENNSIQVTPPKSIHLPEGTPPTLQYRNPRMEDASESQNTKRRKADDYTATSTPPIPSKHTPSSTHTRNRKGSTLSIDMVGHMWLGFHMHESLSIQKGKKVLKEVRTDEEFKVIGTPPTEIHEFRMLRQAFPRTRQLLYPSERPDAVPGQHLHFTQVLMYEKISHDTGLTEGFHITIRFDGEYKSLNRREVKSACLDRLRIMHIPLGTTYSNPIDIGINTVTRNWAGFIKLHLLHPKIDGLALLRGERAFVMTMGDGESIIGKVEKGFELITKAKNMRPHLKGETIRNHEAVDILRTLMRDAYYDGREIEILSLTKSDTERDFAFITLTTEEAREDVLRNGLIYHSERLKVSLTKDKDIGNSSELKISTTLVANNLPQRESQSTITKALKRLFGDDNIAGITYGYNLNQGDDRQSGWCHIQCLNAAVYTEWLRKSAYILGRRVDFFPHKGSMDGTSPNPTAIRLAHAPVREVLAQKAQAMHNAASSPLVSEKLFTKTIKDLVATVDDKLTTLTNNINLNTDKRIEASTETLTTHATNIHNVMGAMAIEFQHSNNRMHNLMQTLAATTPEHPHTTLARLAPPFGTSPANVQEGDNMHHLAPPGFSGAQYRSPSTSLHKDHHNLHD